MKKTTMAEATAFLRAVEELYPPDQRLFDDPYSARLTSPFFRFFITLMRTPPLLRAVMGLRERQTPGVVGGILCRTRYLDGVVKQAIQEGFEALVNLGAGLDSRPLRLTALHNIQVFEVDHPTVIEAKRRRLNQPPLYLPDNLTLVALDFHQQGLGEALGLAGYTPSLKTLFIWEGVTQYLRPQAFQATLQAIAHAAPGSRVAFTYVIKDFLAHPENYPEYKTLRGQFQMAGVEWVNGLDPHTMKDQLAPFGLKLIEDIGAAEHQERFLKPLGRRLNVMAIERIALAEVAPRPPA